MARIRIDDLPVRVQLTPEEMQELWGAGRRPAFRPQLECLEDRLLMSAVPNLLPVTSAGDNYGWTIQKLPPLDGHDGYKITGSLTPRYLNGNPGQWAAAVDGFAFDAPAGTDVSMTYDNNVPANSLFNPYTYLGFDSWASNLVGTGGYRNTRPENHQTLDHFTLPTVGKAGKWIIHAGADAFDGQSPAIVNSQPAPTFTYTLTLQLSGGQGQVGGTGLPDIAVTGAQFTGPSKIAFQYQTHAQPNSNAPMPGTFKVAVFRSLDATFSANDVRLPGDFTVSGTGTSAVLDLGAPPKADPAHPYFLVVADPDNQIAETTKANNFAATQYQQTQIVATLSGGVLDITGVPDAPNTINVQDVGQQISVDGGAAGAVTIYFVDGGGQQASVAEGSVTKIQVHGGNLGDTINLSVKNAEINRPTSVWGGPGNDSITGAKFAANWIDGGGGDDTIHGGIFKDFLFGHGGNVRLYGGATSNELSKDWLDPGARNVPVFSEAGLSQYVNARQWATVEPRVEDVVQPSSSITCTFLASLASVARNHSYQIGGPDGRKDLKDGIRYLGNFQYGVTLFNGSQWQEYVVNFDGTLDAADPRSPDDNHQQFWTVLYERAYLQMLGVKADDPRLGKDNGYDARRALQALTGQGTIKLSGDDWHNGATGRNPQVLSQAVWRQIKSALDEGREVVAGTGQWWTAQLLGLVGVESDVYGVIPHHAYAVVNATEVNGLRTIELDDLTGASHLILTWQQFWYAFSGIAGNVTIRQTVPDAPLGGKAGALGAGWLGQSTTGEQIAPDGVGLYEEFQNATIYWSPQTGAHEVHGAIRQEYLKLGGPTGLLGYPTTDETGLTIGGRFNNFQNGIILWSQSTGAHEVHGPIRDLYASLWTTSPLGLPTSDGQQTADGVGLHQDFQSGSIYWSPQTGAHAVRGPIRDVYVQLGGAVSWLGYPTGEEYAANGGRRSDFQFGYLSWDGVAGDSVVFGRPAPAAPTALTGTALSATQVQLSWTGVAGATGYTIRQWLGGKWVQIGTAGAGTTSVTVSNLGAGSTNYFDVGAYNSTGSTFSAYVTATTLPAAPTGLTFRVLSATQVQLSWAGVSGASGYTIRQWINGKWVQIGAFGSGTTSVTVSNLGAGSTSYFDVGASNSAGSTFGNWITVNT